MRKLISFAATAAAAALVLAACSDPAPTTEGSDAAPGGEQSGSEGFDISQIEAVADIAAMVPDTLVTANVLTNGASTDYPPAEFLMEDAVTPYGYDIDIVQALAAVMGLEKGVTKTADFSTIIPALGSKFDVGASSFTITPERLEQVNMVSYLEVGSSFGVAKGNPKNFTPEDPCGFVIGVQEGTYQQELAGILSAECEAEGKAKIDIKPLVHQPDITTKVVGGQYDATFADAPVIGYAIVQSNGQIEEVGDVIESAPQGIAIAKADEQLTAAVQAAMQHLMDQGYLDQILAVYGAEGSALKQAKVNPTV
ncbi:ABC transporter substrate-binding protein [Actinomyces minihominis]|uniref:ABC transporter substrate-binding protein n=1 Tax=Actinomyces minihominis TaxID=2002838 RepID=UPI000C086DB4|nr:ABC transporter substrate-binding protein [Actinomyces minihominis]